MEPPKEREQLLALKVMRLTRPSLMVTHPICSDQRDIPSETFKQLQSVDIGTDLDLPHHAISSLLTLPQNFGNIFLGETFSSYISVHNDSSQLCKDIQIKADLQTGSQRLSLQLERMQPASELTPQNSIDDIIHHEVKELGTHILVCAVSYTIQTGEKMYFRKFFKFQVLKPLDVKTKFFNTEDSLTDDVYLEVQIQNITPGIVCMESITLDPVPLYTCQPLNTVEGQSNKTELVFGKVNCMSTMDTRQYIYCLCPKPEMYSDVKTVKEKLANIGKLDIVWRTNLGEKGRLQTSQLQRMVPGYGDIRLTIEKIPDTVTLEKPFPFTCRVANRSERTMDLLLVLQSNMKTGALWCGTSGTPLGKVPPGGTIDLHLSMIPIQPGLLTLSGLKITDIFLKRTYEHDEFAQVFVYKSNPDTAIHVS